jgi:hypothetical protein
MSVHKDMPYGQKRVSRPNAFCVAVTLSGIVSDTNSRMMRNSPCTGKGTVTHSSLGRAFRIRRRVSG